MGRVTLVLATLIILLAAHSSHGGWISTLIKTSIKAGTKATGRAIVRGGKSFGRGVVRGGQFIGRRGRVIGRGVANGMKKAPGKGLGFVKSNPYTFASFVTSVATCFAASQISGRDTCRDDCQHIQLEIEATNSSIVETMKKMETDVKEIEELHIDVTMLIETSQNISYYFEKLGDIVNQTITENERTTGISEMVEAAFNGSRIDELAREDLTLALAEGVTMLTDKIAEEHRTLETVDDVMFKGGLGIAISGVAITFGAQKYALSQALKVNDGLRYLVPKDAIKKVLDGKSVNKMIWPDLVRSEKGHKAMKIWRRAQKFSKVMKTVGKALSLAGTAVCGAMIGLQIKTESDVLAIQRKTLITLNELDTNLKGNSSEIESMLTNVTTDTNWIIKKMKQEYENLFTLAAKSLCSSPLNSNSSECKHFDEQGCHLNNSIATFKDGIDNLNKAIRNTYNYFSDKVEHEKRKADQKFGALELIKQFKQFNIDAPSSCKILQVAYKESADIVCEELYSSGLYPGLGIWSPWTDGACSPTDCQMIKHRTCPPGPVCFGSNQTMVPCSTPCITQQGQEMDITFKREMVNYC